MARSLAEAFVALEPDATGFATKAKALLDKNKLEATAKITLDAARAQLDIGTLQARIKELTSRAGQVKLGADDKDAQAVLLRLDARLSALGRRVTSPKLTIEGQQRALADILSVDAALDKLEAKETAAAGTTTALGAAGRGAGGWFGLLSRQVPLFGGALGALPLIGAVSGFHLLADAIIETTAVVVPAGIAFGVFGAAAVPTVQDIVQQVQTLNTVSKATGQQIPGLSGGFQQMAAAVQPQVYTLLGEALNTLNSKGSQFTGLAKSAGAALDQLGARAELAFTSGGMGTFLKNGPADLAKIGDLVANIFGTVGNLLKAMPGYAEVGLNVLDKVTRGLEAVTSSGLVQGVLHAGLAIHGFALYTGLAATAVGLLGSPLGRAANALAGFGKYSDTATASLDKNAGRVATAKAGWTDLGNALPFVGSGIASLGKDTEGAAGKFSIATAGTKLWQGALGLLTKGWPVLAAAGAVALGVLVVELATAKDATQKWFDSVEQSIAGQKTFYDVVSVTEVALAHANAELAITPKYTEAASGAAARFASASQAVNSQYTEWSANAAKLAAQHGLETQRLTQLAGVTGNVGTALGYFNQLGIKASDIATASAAKWNQDIAALKGLMTATTDLAGFQGGPALAAQNALNQAANEQNKAITSITQAQEQLIAVVTGGRIAFDTFEQGIFTLASNLNQATNSGNTTSFTLAHIKEQASLAGASLAGTSQASYALNQAFYTEVQNGQKLISSLEQQHISTANLTTVVATAGQQLLGFAGHNQEARAVVVDLINNALGPGTVTLQNLNKWVGQNSTTMGGFNSIIAQATINASKLAATLADDVNKEMAQAVAQAYGGQYAFTQFAQSVHGGDLTSQGFVKSGEHVIEQLIKSTGNAGQARGAFSDFAQNGLGLSKWQADNLWGSLRRQLLVEAANKAGETRSQFNNLASSLGYSKSQADKLWASLHKVSSGSPYNAHVYVSTSGSGSLFINAHTPYSNPKYDLALRAAGGMIGGTGNRDSVPALLTPGEAVVPRRLVPAVAPLLSAGGVPGFASGGLIGQLGQIGPWATSHESDWARTIDTWLVKTAWNDLKNSAASGIPSAAAAGSGPAMQIARRLLAAMGWGNQWAAFNDLVMRESGWNVHARNPSSGAYGIPQALPPSKMASAGADWASSAATQLRWMMGYIGGRYGSPAAADRHELSYHWYDNGGMLPPGLSLAYNGTGRPEPVVASGFRSDGPEQLLGRIERHLSEAVSLLRQAPAATGAHTGAAVADGFRGVSTGIRQLGYYGTR